VRASALLGIDAGTTAVKAVLHDADLRPLAAARRALDTHHSAPGHVEQNGEQILAAVVDAVAEVLEAAGYTAVDGPLATGLDHQGESVLAWEARGDRALTPVISWQDKRHADELARIDGAVAARSGLPLDPYFSAGKLAWLLAHDDAVGAARRAGRLRIGTVDAYLSERLGGPFATDLSTASRTQLLALGGGDWDDELLAACGVPRALLPELLPTIGVRGELRHPRWPVALTLAAQLVDQQAALAGAGCIRAGEVKATYGTGVFVLGHSGAQPPSPRPGLLPTVAWSTPAGADYALDGGVFTAGALLDWLADLGLARDGAALAASAAADSSGVLVLPALAGLGAPWWRPHARAVIAGLTGAAGVPQVARAALEAIAWRVADIVELIGAQALRVDGGLTRSATLLQLQADALGLPVDAIAADGTARGAALLAGVASGCFADLEQAVARLPPPTRVEPSADASWRAAGRARWRAFVEACAALP
jgi:glycerol kinase